MRVLLPVMLAAALGAASASGAAQRLSFGSVNLDPTRDLPVAASAQTGPGWRLIQYDQRPTQRDRDALTAQGLRVVQYYPDNAYLVWGDAAALQRSAQSPAVRWHGDFRPEWKRSPDLNGRAGTIDNVQVLVYNDGQLDRVLTPIQRLGAVVQSAAPAQPDGVLWQLIVRVDASRLGHIQDLADVIWLEYSGPQPQLDDEASSQIVAGNYVPPGALAGPGYLPFLDSLGLTGAGVRFAVTDSGVDYAHPELGPRIVDGYDFPGCESASGLPGDDRVTGGHGTHVAGILAGAGVISGALDGTGYHHGIGVAPEVAIVALNPVCGSIAQWPPANGWQDLSQRALTRGAIGSNNSWNTGESYGLGYQATARAHDFIVRDGDFDAAGNQGFVLVFSAGNAGPGPNTITAPKEAKNLIVVGNALSARPAPLIDHIAPTSSRGPTLDGRIVPTIVAPGDSIASTRRIGGANFCGIPISETGANQDFAYCSGTSMATPHAAGLAVLLTQAWREAHDGATPSPAMLKALLVNGAIDMAGPPPVPNTAEGWGRVHLTRSLGSGRSRVVIDQTELLDDADDEYVANLIVDTPGEPVRVTLAWTDAPGAPGANPALVNDLDLEVVVGQRLYRGNVFEDGRSITGGIADSLNNLENVYLPNSSQRSLSVRVRARALPGDGVPAVGDDTDQDFALVCSNCSAEPDFTLSLESAAFAVCAGRPLEIGVDFTPLLDFTDPVDLNIVGWPAPGGALFDANPMTTLPGRSTLHLDSSGLLPDTYGLFLNAASPGRNHAAQFTVAVSTMPPTAPSLIQPAAGASQVALTPMLQWAAVAQAESYRVDIATDLAFTQIVASTDTTLDRWTPGQPLQANTRYYWRVQARNTCSAPELLADGFEAPATIVGTPSEIREFHSGP